MCFSYREWPKKITFPEEILHRGNVTLGITFFTSNHPHVHTTILQILALPDYITWVLHTDPCIDWLHILCLTHESLNCLITYFGFHTQILSLLDYICWVLHTDPCIA